MSPAVREPKDLLGAALRERGGVGTELPVIAAWRGRVAELSSDRTEFRASGVELAELPAAILGVTARSGHLLSRFGMFSFVLSDGLGMIGRVGLFVDMPVACATQLDEMSRFASGRRGGREYQAERHNAHRTASKSRRTHHRSA